MHRMVAGYFASIVQELPPVNNEVKVVDQGFATGVDGQVLSPAELKCLREFFELLLEWQEKANSHAHRN